MKKSIALSGAALFSASVSFATVYVSPTGLHSGGFATPTHAATNIQAAVDVATNGQTVVVLDGTYLLSSQVVVSNAISIVASNPPPAVVVDGQGATRCFYLADTGCTLAGLVITNGVADGSEGQYEGGGVFCEGTTPFITNCIIVGCQAESGGGIAFGTVNASVIRGNSAVYGGGCLQSVVWRSDLVGNTAMEYGGAFEGTEFGNAGALYYCRIIGNEAGLEGGGVDNGAEIYNSLLTGNMAGDAGGAVAFDCKVVNCTVVSNHCDGTAYTGGGGVATSDIFNSIISGNTSSTIYPDIEYEDYFADTISNSCSPDLVHEVDGNITNLPAFVDFEGGDYQLDIGSPGIDAGINSLITNLVVDLAGAMRINNGTVDMGAFEFYPPPYDLDADRMRDGWEIEYFGSTNAVPDGAGDTDPFSNLEEFIAGTDPTNPASFFAITNWSVGSFMVGWGSVSNREYTVHWTDSLTNAFQPLFPTVEYPANSFTDLVHTTESAGFYKVKVRLK